MTTGTDHPGPMPCLFLPHGGGPLPLLGEPRHAAMCDALPRLAARLPRPRAIVVVSAHWEAAVPTVTTAAVPRLLYDYRGFPPESYTISYPAPGAPELAERICALLTAGGWNPQRDAGRGLDHGVFVPLKLLYPEADIPVVQLSLIETLDPAQHLAMGEALRPLAGDGVLVLGSGFTFHNMRSLMAPAGSGPDDGNLAFEDWLVQTCSGPDMDDAERRRRLLGWAEAPHARHCHPREEHLLPLHVCAGMGSGAAQLVFDDCILDRRTTGYLWHCA